MRFEKLNEKYTEEAVRLAQIHYINEQEHIEALYNKDYKTVFSDMLSEMFKQNYGLVAIENGKVKGYLSFWGEIKNFFGYVKGAFSPVYANAYDGDNRNKIASLLFQYASEEMVTKEVLSFGICVYSHDIEIMKALAMNGFGIRCSDGIRSVDKPLDIQLNKEYVYEEIHYGEAVCLLPLYNELMKHLGKSPTYFPHKEKAEEDFVGMCNKQRSRFFVARHSSDIIGYFEITNEGEAFITEEPDYMHICGAYLKESYRGKNILQSLLLFVLDTLKKEGVKRLGVDYETINPSALGFWSKYFDSYTYSFVRRIDERILEQDSQ